MHFQFSVQEGATVTPGTVIALVAKGAVTSTAEPRVLATQEATPPVQPPPLSQPQQQPAKPVATFAALPRGADEARLPPKDRERRV